MSLPGKNYPGQIGFPTPNEEPGEDGYRVFLFPNSEEWAGILMGALKPLTFAYNWYQWGAFLPEEAALLWSDIIQQSYTNTLVCQLPTGTPVFRLGTDGNVEQYNGAAWEVPSGDYELPPPEDRGESTPDERMCAASANAANVLKQLYESLSDSWAAELNAADAAIDLLEILAIVTGVVFVPVVGALIAIGVLLFDVLYDTLEFIGADVWTDDFDAELVCLLLECASDDGAKVTFDFKCFMDALARQTSLDFTASELRLFGQISYIMTFIGKQALDYAGGTTAIVDPDCTACPGEYVFDFVANGEQSWTVVLGHGQWDSGGSFFELKCFGGVGSIAECRIERGLAFASTFYRVEADVNVIGAGIDEFNFFVGSSGSPVLAHSFGGASAGIQTLGGDITPVSSDYLRIDIADSNGCGSTDCQIYALRFFFA